MNDKEVKKTADDNQLSRGGAFKVRNAMIAGVFTHIVSLIMLMASAFIFVAIIKSGEIRSWKLAVAILAVLYSMACLISSISFNVFGKFICIRLNEITKDNCSAWFDRRVVASYKGFTKEFEVVLKKSLFNNEIFFVRIHQAIRRVIRNEPFAWLIQFLVSPFVLVPFLINSIFLPHRKAVAIKAGKELDDAFRLAYMDAKDFVEDRFSDEDEYFKEILTTLFCIYNILKRGHTLGPIDERAEKISIFLKKYCINGLNTLYIGDAMGIGNVEKFVFIVSEVVSKSHSIEIDFNRKMEIVDVFKMELGLRYVEEGEEALIVNKSDYAVVKGIKSLCMVMLFPLAIIFMAVGIYTINIVPGLIGVLLLGGAISILATIFCLQGLGNIRIRGLKIISDLYLRRKYREKISREILADLEAGLIQPEYREKCEQLLERLKKPLDEELPQPPKQNHKIYLYENRQVTKEI